MRFKKHEVVISKKRIIEPACGDHPLFLLCSKGQELEVMSLFPKEGYPVHGRDSYSVRDLDGLQGEFFIDESELESVDKKGEIMKISFTDFKNMAIKGFFKLRDELCLIDLENIPDGESFQYENKTYIRMTSVEWPRGKIYVICREGEYFNGEWKTFDSIIKVKPVFDDES